MPEACCPFENVRNAVTLASIIGNVRTSQRPARVRVPKQGEAVKARHFRLLPPVRPMIFLSVRASCHYGLLAHVS